MFLADFHVHTNFSDGKHPIRDVVDAFGRRGFGAIAITDHLCERHSFLGHGARLLNRTLTPENFPIYLKTVHEEAARAWDQYKMVLIPGFELTKNYLSNDRSAHLLGLGISRFIPADGDLVDLARAIRTQGALAIGAHPVNTRKTEKQTYGLWHRRDELTAELDAWEVASGPYLFDEVLHTRLPKIASSDLHGLKQMSSWKTVLDCERHPEAILDAIRRQEISFEFYSDPTVSFNLYAKGSAVSLGSRYQQSPG